MPGPASPPTLTLMTAPALDCKELPHITQLQGATLHLWSSDDAWTSFTSHSDPDESYSGTLSLKTGGFEVRNMLDSDNVCTAGAGGRGAEYPDDSYSGTPSLNTSGFEVRELVLPRKPQMQAAPAHQQ